MSRTRPASPARSIHGHAVAGRPGRTGSRCAALVAAGLLAAGSLLAISDGPATAATTCERYRQNDEVPLTRCDAGPLVADVQERLNRLIDLPIAVDGYFGPVTERAVREFQRANGLAVDGIVGPSTWAMLSGPVGCASYDVASALPMRACDQGLLVARLQQLLLERSPGNIQVDGYFGPATEAEVRAFQAANGLAVDGIVGPLTWWALHTA